MRTTSLNSMEAFYFMYKYLNKLKEKATESTAKIDKISTALSAASVDIDHNPEKESFVKLVELNDSLMEESKNLSAYLDILAVYCGNLSESVKIDDTIKDFTEFKLEVDAQTDYNDGSVFLLPLDEETDDISWQVDVLNICADTLFAYESDSLLTKIFFEIIFYAIVRAGVDPSKIRIDGISIDEIDDFTMNVKIDEFST